MKAQGICPVCGAAVGVKPGDVAVQHTRNRGGWSYGRTRCEGSGAVADVAAWIAREQASAVELGDKVISEVQIEVFCEEVDVAKTTDIIGRVARTGHADGGWIYVSAIEQAIPINDASEAASREAT